MPIIKKKVIRSIPEQVAKNTSDIIDLQDSMLISRPVDRVIDNIKIENEDEFTLKISITFKKNVMPFGNVEFDFNTPEANKILNIHLESYNNFQNISIKDEYNENYSGYSNLILTNVGTPDNKAVLSLDINYSAQVEAADYKFIEFNSLMTLNLVGEIDIAE